MDQQKAEVAGALVPVLVPVARSLVKERMQRKTLQEKKETQLEILEAKQQTPSGRDTPDLAEAFVADDGGGSEWDDAIHRIQADETCELCSQLLDGVLKLAPEKRGQALSEFGRFKQIVDDTEDTEAVKKALADLPVLKEAMNEEFGGHSSM